MLYIYICDDIPEQLQMTENYISDLILLKKWDIKIAGTFSAPAQLLDSLTESRTPGLYFLDIELHSDMDGIQLASKIRSVDPFGFIVFITSHSEYMSKVFHHNIEALDFIQKSSPASLKDSLCTILHTSYDRYLKRQTTRPETFIFKSGSQVYLFETSKILYIEALPKTHQVRLHTEIEQVTGYESLSELSARLGSSFFFCHRSYIVNIRHVISIDIKSKMLLLDTGVSLPVAHRKMPELLRAFENHRQRISI